MEELLPRVKNAEARSDYTILITFQNGERKEYDVKPLLQYPMYRNLEKVFPAAAVQFGTVVWPGDLDISPDTLYMNGKPVNDIGDGSNGVKIRTFPEKYSKNRKKYLTNE